MPTRLLLTFFVLSLLLSTPSLIRIPRFLPFAKAETRAALSEAVTTLEEKGIWLVNSDLRSIEERKQGICFRWEHRYTSGGGTSEPSYILTCGSR